MGDEESFPTGEANYQDPSFCEVNLKWSSACAYPLPNVDVPLKLISKRGNFTCFFFSDPLTTDPTGKTHPFLIQVH